MDFLSRKYIANTLVSGHELWFDCRKLKSRRGTRCKVLSTNHSPHTPRDRAGRTRCVDHAVDVARGKMMKYFILDKVVSSK